MIITLSILSVLFSAISGISKAICDLSEEQKIKWNPNYWHKSKSWRNKWKNGDSRNGERFFGSSRWFVFTTDAWHLFGLLQRVTLITSFVLVGVVIGKYNLIYLLLLLGNYIIFVSIFHIFHTYKILKK